MESVENIAATVLYEGFLLYPYTRSALKNQQRWTFGGVYPRGFSEWSGGHDPSVMQTQCLCTGGTQTLVHIKIRFLQVVDRTVLQMVQGHDVVVDELRLGEEVYRPWEESVERDQDWTFPLDVLTRAARSEEISIPAGQLTEPLYAPDGTRSGTLMRHWEAIEETIEFRAEPVQRVATASDDMLYRLTVRIVNATPWEPPENQNSSDARRLAVRHTSISTHTILRLEHGEFISLLETPEHYAAEASTCRNLHTWPVLAGESDDRHILLSSPIILYDYPQVSVQTPGDLFDATEIDELLRLSIMTLTDQEKQEMRESDPRAREILERTETLRPDELMNLHASVRTIQSRESWMP